MKTKKKHLRSDLLPVIFMTGVLPLVVKGQKVGVTLGKYSWFPDGSFQYDFFIYWKSILFLILTGWMAVMLIDRRIIRQLKFRHIRMCIPLLVYGGLTVLSTALSVDKDLSLKGMWQQYESVWVLLGYMIAVFYCMQVIESLKDVRMILTATAAGAFVQGILGLTQFTGKDFFSTEAGKTFLTVGMDSSVKEALRFHYGENSEVYMASYTPDYAGIYLVVLFPILFFLAVTAGKIWQKVLWSILFGILMICLWGSGSRAGLLAAGILLITGTLFQVIRNKKQKSLIYGIVGICLAAGLLTSYDLVNDHTITKAVAEIFHKESYDLTEIETESDGVLLTYRQNRIRITPETTDMGQILTATFNDESKDTAVWNTEKNCFVFEDTQYEDLEFDAYSQDSVQYLIMKNQEITWNFYKRPDSDRYVYINQYSKEDTIQNAAAVWKGHEKALSGRGYIWGRTIPLILKHLIWGSGPDTFAAEFPQTDYVMKANTGAGMYQQLPTKAHSLYLQTALQTGVLSLLCLMLFWGRYLICFIKTFFGNKNKAAGGIKLAIFLGIAGFLFMGFLNDSNLAVSPVFWCLLGTGIAVEKIRE